MIALYILSFFYFIFAVMICIGAFCFGMWGIVQGIYWIVKKLLDMVDKAW